MIRPATEADAGGVAALWNHFIRDTLVTFNATEKTVEEVAATIAGRQRSGHAFLLAEAEAGGRVAGFVTYAQFRGGVGYARTMEHTILLDAPARGRGLGRALMAAAEDHARGAGVRSMFGGVSGANPEGRAFHLAMGFAEVAVLPGVGHKRDRWFDLHLMQKIL
jgi:L-amino acid N-acyltransferase